MKEKERIINNYMKKLDISKEEAEELYSFDFEGAENDVVDNLTKLAKDNLKSNYVCSQVDVKRHRNHVENPTKTLIISMCDTALKTIAAIDITIAPEKEIEFKYKGTPYNLKLTKHNKYVGIKETKDAKRKVNAQKAEILASIVESLKTDPSISNILVQTETKVNFNVAETNYTIALTAHTRNRK